VAKSDAPTALLCSSGLGTRGGGVGVVAQFLQQALAQRYRVVHLEYQANQGLGARLQFAARLAREQWRGHALQLYSHIDLMRSLPFTPRPKPKSHQAARDVLFLHGIEVWRALDKARLSALQNATLLTNSDFTAAKARSLHPSMARSTTVHLAAEFAPAPTPTQIVAAKAVVPTVVIVGRMSSTERYKGHDQLIAAWPQVLQALPVAELVCIGSGDDVTRLQAQAASGVRFVQGLSDAARDQLLQSAQLFAFPSTGEGFGLAAIEAASMGLPVLGIAGTVLAEILPTHQGGMFVAEQSSELLAQAIISALQQPELLLQQGQRAMQHVRANYAPADFFARFWRALDTPAH
jgi:phosphatidyl-myo-inositol dimannoside synthase